MYDEMTKSASRMNVKMLALTGLMAAVICILGPLSFSIPISPVPFSLGTLAIYFAVSVLGMKRGALSVIIYILLGLAGLPVFSGFGSGAGKLLGPTGGYIIGYLFMAVVCGHFADKFSKRPPIFFLGMALGTIVCYLFGTFWLALQSSMSFSAALWAGVIPFIPGDIVKLILAGALGLQLKGRLKRAGLI
nr:biotin transporter BioY [uncultured Acetatifactor sp.]